MLRSVDAAVSPPIPAPTIAIVNFFWPIWYPFLLCERKLRARILAQRTIGLQRRRVFQRGGARPASSLQPKQAVELLDDAAALASCVFESFGIEDFNRYELRDLETEFGRPL